MKADEQTDELPLDRFLISLDKTNRYLNLVRREGVCRLCVVAMTTLIKSKISLKTLEYQERDEANTLYNQRQIPQTRPKW